MKYSIKNFAGTACFLLMGGSAAAEYFPNPCYCGQLTDYKQSWIANSGGVPATHVPHSMRALYVHPDGRAVTICEWDEGGTNIGVFKDNAIVCVPKNSGTGSYGRNSGAALAMDDRYIYQLMRFNGRSGANSNMNSNGLPQFPPANNDIEWQVVNLYDAETGNESRFDRGYGPGGNMMIIATQADRCPKGIAVTDKYLVASLPRNSKDEYSTDSLMIYDKTNLNGVAIRRFKIEKAGYIYADRKGYVWILQDKKIVPVNLSTGAILERAVVTLPADADIKSFSIDTRSGRERLLLANSGKDMNVLIYTNIYAAPTLTSTFGVTGGIFSTADGYKRGQMGPLRFEGPTGVGVDNDGNIYVSNMFVGSTGATLHAYKEATGELLWKQEGLVFTATADFDNTLPNRVYCPERIYDIDYSKSECRIDHLVATTVDPFNFPGDLRLEPNPPSPIKTGVFKRKIKGTDYLFVGNMYSTTLAGYRFDPEKWGYIAVPFMKIMADKLSFWYDANADGQPDDKETVITSANGGTFSQYVDSEGTIWMADRSQVAGKKAFLRRWRVLPELKNGFIQYGPEEICELPSYITDISRVLYDPEKDELILGGYTTSRPWTNPKLWGQVGTTILIYDNATKKLADNAPDLWTPKVQIDLPFDIKGDDGRNTGEDIKGMMFTENYIYGQQQQGGVINVYSRHDGDYLGNISPTAVVQRQSGWTDFTFAMNARENADGTTEILAEENAFAKVVHYKLNSLDAKMTRLGDLIPYRIQVLDPQGRAFDIDRIHEDDPIRFQVWVKNIARGPVTKRRANIQNRCTVRFNLVDVKSGEKIYTVLSDNYEQDIQGGETLLFTPGASASEWKYKSGDYRLEIYVNYGNAGNECRTDNNQDAVTFGGVAQTAGIDEVEFGRTVDYRIINVAGVVVRQESADTPDLSCLSAGIYCIEQTDDAGNRKSEKIIIK